MSVQTPDNSQCSNIPDTPKDILFLLDASGSMWSMGPEPLQALNGFISSQAELKVPGSRFSLWYFSHTTQLIISDQPLDSIKEVTEYKPDGMTALYDAIGDAVSEKLKTAQKSDVVCVVLTDGAENASSRYTSSDIRKLVKTAEEKHNWKFVFLGANQDAFEAGSMVGIHRCAEFECTEGDLEGMVRTSSQAIGRFRTDPGVQDIHVDSSPAAKKARNRRVASAPVGAANEATLTRSGSRH